ncbi:hypothetical protein ACFFHH_16335 [Cytobacillus solani]|uniref:hypothetical protein n=1 Tax=Cytobacillus solani TaxID=1637975 RepID=UPI0011500629|nr:hypothetical protein [Cytobacillus solani]
MKKRIMLVIGLCLLFISTTAYAASGLVQNTAALTASYSTAGGQPHYLVNGTSTTVEKNLAAGNVREINAQLSLYRNGVALKSDTKYEYKTTKATQSLTNNEYTGNINYKVYTYGQATYSDGGFSQDSDTRTITVSTVQ